MKTIIIVLVSLISMNSYASETKERIYLTQMLNQLESIKPIIVSAAREQPKLNRTQFHYTAYKDSEGKSHNGLLDDINEIENGIQEKLNHIPNAPRTVAGIKGDYIDHSIPTTKVTREVA